MASPPRNAAGEVRAAMTAFEAAHPSIVLPGQVPDWVEEERLNLIVSRYRPHNRWIDVLRLFREAYVSF
jgi:hypothetical protein